MTQVIGTIALYTGLLAFFWELSLQLIPQDRKKPYTLSVLAVYFLVVVLLLLNQARLTQFYQQYTNEIIAVLSSLTMICLALLVLGTRRSRSMARYWDEKILVKEYFEADALEHPMKISVDGRRHCGPYYFNGRCLLLPAGKYKLTVDPADPGGWSAWDRDDHPALKSFEGPWTWNLLVSVPGVTNDFRDKQYYRIQSFEKAWRLGRWNNSWIFRSKTEITYSRLVNKGFTVELDFDLEFTSPVWFWIWDHKPRDNRGHVNVLLFRLDGPTKSQPAQ